MRHTIFIHSTGCKSLRYFLFFVLFLAAKNLISQPALQLTPVVTSGTNVLNQPIQLVNAGDGSNRVFLVEQTDTILVFNSNFGNGKVFLSVSNVLAGGERGLLSMAFHPNYAGNGLFYVYYTNLDGNLELARYHANPSDDFADPTSKVILKIIPHPTNSNHNGGTLHFGNDGFLYLSTGDGGGAGDVPNNAQNTSVLLGKMLRFNVNTSLTPPYYTIPPGNPFGNEIFHIGLRNPFRWSFDRLTHDMWIGDVGQALVEEIDFLPAGTTTGVNFGWRCMEGNDIYNGGSCNSATTYTAPVYTYPHVGSTSAAVTGGIVYRGTKYPALQGYNISADFYSGIFYKTISNGAGGWNTSLQTLTPNGIADFGEAENGEAYAVSLTANKIYSVDVSGALPVTLINFLGTAVSSGIKLNWQTSSEQNLKQFQIEYSTNGNTFINAGNVPAKNISSGALYSFLHGINYDGILFYRLKMVDLNGAAHYSDIIRISVNNKPTPFIAPSFIRNGIISIHPAGRSFKSLELISMSGRILLQKIIAGQTGNINILTGKISAGVYIARLTGNEQAVIQKVVIQ